MNAEMLHLRHSKGENEPHNYHISTNPSIDPCTRNRRSLLQEGRNSDADLKLPDYHDKGFYTSRRKMEIPKRAKTDWAWHMPAMLGCSTVCPNCKHQFTCCAPVPSCCTSGRTSACPSPQVSPSAPLTFVLPPFVAPQPPPEVQPETEVVRLRESKRALETSGWFYQGLTFDRSDELLKDTKVGTFLVRNSSDPRYLYSLSVQTERGPKSVRLFYVNGCFRLDAQPHLQPAMPLFPGVVELVEHYARRRKDGQVWVDPQGKCLSAIYLDQPRRKEGKPPALKHLARLAINRALKDTSKTRVLRLELPASLTAYLKEYPHSL